MKRGEKAAMWFAGAIVAGITGLTFYLESNSELSGERMMAEQMISSGSNPAPQMTDVAMIPVGLNPYDLPEAGGHGASLLTIYCIQCHDLPSPAMHTAQEWPAILERMDEYIQQRRGGMLARIAMPSKTDWQDLQSYLSQHGQKPLNPTAYDDIDSLEAQQFQTTCSQCHAAPAPEMHQAKEWPRTVLRMKHHMERTGKTIPDNGQTELIVTFLQRHAAVATTGTP